MRAQRRTQKLPVIFLTERRDCTNRLRGLEQGVVVDYITKPFDILELRWRVRNAPKRGSLETLVNPVTGVREGALVDERLSQRLGATGWALLIVTVRGLDAVREAYGFVAFDDVLRAATLTSKDAVREAGGGGDSVGHLSPEAFAIVTPEGRAREWGKRIHSRRAQSIEYFYPLKDRPLSPGADRIRLLPGAVNASQAPAEYLDTLETAALGSRSA